MKKGTLARILKYARPYSKYTLLALAGAVVSVLMTLVAPVLVGRAIDCVFGPGDVDFPAIFRILLLVGGAIGLSALFQWLMNVYTRKVSALASRDMRREAFDRLSRVPLKYIDSRRHGDIISRLVNDADAVADGLLQGMTQLLPGLVTIAGTLIIMLVINPVMALVVVLVTPASIFFAKFIATRTSDLFKKQSAAQGRLSGYVREMVSGQNVVEAFDAQKGCIEAFEQINEEMYTSGLKAIFYSSVTNPGTRFVNSVVYAAVGVIGAIMAIAGRLSVGQLSAFLTYANQYTKPFNEVTGVLTQFQTALASAERLFQLIDEEAEPADAPDALSPDGCEGHVRVEDVSFSYSPDVRLIEGFNLDVKPGRKVAIVGPTGCGKTTLINLLMRFYDVNKGRILVDGHPIQALTRDSLRGMYGMVLQETWLKQATVRENIAYGRPNASEEEIVAHAHSFIKRLPNGYDTVISASGGNLSAGQKQLLCIARIMLCQPDMLILDEATSSIDTRTEMLIQQAFETLMKGHTSFVVAHRLSTIQTADLILVMNAGQIVEQGTHAELLDKGGFYARLYNSQFAVQ